MGETYDKKAASSDGNKEKAAGCIYKNDSEAWL